MLDYQIYDNIILTIISGEMAVDEAVQIIDVITAKIEASEDIYMITIPIQMTVYPTKVAEMIKVGQALQEAQRNVKRVYGIKYNALFSFLASVTAQVFRIKSNTVEAANLNDLFQIIERDTEIFPTLKRSWEKHGDAIKDKLNHYEPEKLA